MAERFTVICGVHLFLIRDQQVLLLRRCHTGYEDGNYSVIAGHLDGGEEVTAAMVREAAEECGISIDRGDLRVVHVMHRKRGDHERVGFFFACDRWAGDVRNAEPDKCDDLRWSSVDDLPPNMVPYVGEALKSFSEGLFFSEFGWEHQAGHIAVDA